MAQPGVETGSESLREGKRGSARRRQQAGSNQLTWRLDVPGIGPVLIDYLLHVRSRDGTLPFAIISFRLQVLVVLGAEDDVGHTVGTRTTEW